MGTAVRPEAVEPCTTNGGGDASRALKLCTIAMELALRHYDSSNVVTPGHVSQAARFIGIWVLLLLAYSYNTRPVPSATVVIVVVACTLWQWQH